ncbi:cyclin-Q-like isoform X2 [Artemia franciscana]|uniref:Cyclin-Q n=2 Tax=Artemia franciscana TaxID=6661 RepID=A0AA88LKE0_ARTSF|nr:hypothetical protein QYM36_007760 [Artemia franciscana]
MANVDVFQRHSTSWKNSLMLDYKQSKHSFYVARFISECGLKLIMEAWTVSLAASYYHKCMKSVSEKDVDPYVVATSCLYLASKNDNRPLRLRDILNVAHSTIHRDSGVLDLTEEYWSLRDSVVQAELLLLRTLEFNTTVNLPHKYMLYYLDSLRQWISPEVWSQVPIIRTSWSFLQDFFHDPSSIDHRPQHIAISVVYLTLQCYGVTIPGACDIEGKTWYEIFCKDMKKETIWSIIDKIVNIYEKEQAILEQKD